MARLETHPFTPDDLPAAGRLLAERHRRHRTHQPLLPAAYEDPDVARAEVAALLGSDGASGTVATRDDQPVGYLLGVSKPGRGWGANAWVEAAGHATADGGQAAVRELYAAAAQRWVEEGRTAHYALLPAHDDRLAAAWFGLAFGHQHTHAVRPPGTPGPLPPGVRRARREDIPDLARLEVELPRHQSLSPTFSAAPWGSVEENLAEWEEDWGDERFTTFVFERDGAVVGSAVGCPLEVSSLHAGPAHPENAAFLGFATVLPEARGIGAGRALGEAVASWAGEAGYTALVTDWRETNLHSSRAWRALGYADTFVRVHRLVGF